MQYISNIVIEFKLSNTIRGDGESGCKAEEFLKIYKLCGIIMLHQDFLFLYSCFFWYFVIFLKMKISVMIGHVRGPLNAQQLKSKKKTQIILGFMKSLDESFSLIRHVLR